MNHPSRMKQYYSAALRVFLAGAIFLSATPTLLAASFTDVPADNPYYSAVESLKNLGIVNGYSDGTFRPDQGVNRAEALKMSLLAAKAQVSPGLYQTGFPDVKLSDWFSGYVFVGLNMKIVKGNPDGTFAPGRQVNKAEFLKMTEQAFGVDLSQYQTMSSVPAADVPDVAAWYVPYLNYAKSVGIVAPTLDNKLEPQKYLTRAECAEIVYKMEIIKNGGPTQELLSTAEARLVDALVRINAGDLQTALTRSQEAVFYTDNALKQNPGSDVTQGASLIAQGFEKLFEAYAAAARKDMAMLRSLADEAKSDADQAVAKDASLLDLSQKLKTLGDKLLTQAGA